MRALIQRVSSASVSVEDKVIASIGKGLVILIGIGRSDSTIQMQTMAEKIALLRLFEDLDGKMNRSLLDTNGTALVISQFTLYANTSKGRRPAFTDAASSDNARRLVEIFINSMKDLGVTTLSGVFGAHMSVNIINDGPVTIMVEN